MAHSVNQVSEGKYEIVLTRGDSLFLDVSMTAGDEPYTPEAGSVRFAMKEKYGDDVEVALEKQIPINTMLLEIKPADTKTLPMGKKYVFDIEFTDQAGNVDTFIEGTFKISNEVD
jgi:hypothetical protein